MGPGGRLKKIYLLFVPLFLALSPGLFADPALDLSQLKSPIALKHHLEYLEDPAGTLTFSEVQGKAQKWIHTREGTSPRWFATSAYWVRFRINTSAQHNQKWIIIHKNKKLHYLDFYRPDSKDGYEKVETGIKREFSTREIPYKRFAFYMKTATTRGEAYYYLYINTRTLINLNLIILPEGEFKRMRARERQLDFMFYSAIISVICLFSVLALALRYTALGYFVGILVFWMGAAIFSQGYQAEFLPFSLSFIHSVHITSLLFIFCSLFIRNFLELKERAPHLNKIILGSLIYCGIMLLTYPIFIRLSGIMNILGFVGMPLISFYSAFYTWRRGFKPARLLLLTSIIFVPLVFLALLSLATTSGTKTYTVLGVSWFKICYLIQVMVMAYALLERIRSLSQSKIDAQAETLVLKEKYNQELELEVQERTRELSASLQETQALKEQQDGDYFLTSLLIKPLSRNTTNSSNVHVSSFIRQNKQVSYQKWNAELGGDFNAAHTLTIDGRAHTVFINADAMGKSMQGAGGALVLGSAFQSIIEQTDSTPQTFSRGPEDWLVATFHALDNIFHSFDGAMLISLVMGVLEDDTGKIFWINAEHPRPVLYREGTVKFLGDESYNCPKLGDRIETKQPIVLQDQLHPGDIFISGSDGRDDIKLPAQNSFIINSDETIFLELVRRNQANLKEIYRSLQNQGTIIDDVSLLRLKFIGPEKKI